ncbi:MAG: aminoglycoside phosphotransferase family protein [Paludibacteraceae bacterium]|nr:aminoglycoside phosphotransferase family protein [Paludibacteraceae bacterium]
MQNIISHFRLTNSVGEPRPLKTGLINDSFILPAAITNGESYFLQRINHHIFTDVEGLQQNIKTVTDHIRKKLIEKQVSDIDNHVLRLIPTLDGKLYYKTAEGDYWRVYHYIGAGHSVEQVNAESAYLAGVAFGEFQNQLSDLNHNALCESIPNFHNIEFRLKQLREAVETDAAGRLSSSRDILAELEKRAEDMCLAERMFREGKLPKRINHCDTKVNNMLFDDHGKPMCIVDLDTVMPGFVFSDFGDFMRTAANTGAEDDSDLNNIHVNMQVFAAYTKGYLSQARFLTPTERNMLPYGCRLLSYMQTVRFFTDWLNGDTYYKILYPEHNLVRTRAQLRLLEEQENCAEQMQRVVME